MKGLRKIFTAGMMVVLSLAMLSTASFAWFAMNAKVSASQMNVKAHAISPYLQIAAGDAKTATDPNFGVSAEAENPNTGEGLFLTTPKTFTAANVFDITPVPLTAKNTKSDFTGQPYFAMDGSNNLILQEDTVEAGTDLTGKYAQPATVQKHESAGKILNLSAKGGTVTYWQAADYGTASFNYKKIVVTNNQEVAADFLVPSDAFKAELTLGEALASDTLYTKADKDAGKLFFEQTSADQPGTIGDFTTSETLYTVVDPASYTVGTWERDGVTYYVSDGKAAIEAVPATLTATEAGKCYLFDSDTNTYYKLSGDEDKVVTETLVENPYWFTANSTDADLVQETNPATMVTEQLEKYRLANSFTMKMGGKDAKDLIVDSISVANKNGWKDDVYETIRVMCVATKIAADGKKTSKTVEYDVVDGFKGTDQDLFGTFETTSIVQVDVYIYFDGTDAKAFSNNVKYDFVDYDVEVNFGVTTE